MQGGNLYGLIIAMLSLAVTVLLTMQHLKQNGFHLEIIVQPAPTYNPPSRRVEQLSELVKPAEVVLFSQHKKR